MTGTDAALKAFFESASFAVLGASTNPDKFGHKSWFPIPQEPPPFIP